MLSVVRKAEKITAKLFFALALLAICFAVIAGADAVLAAATKDATSPVAPLASTEIFGQGEMEQRFFTPPRPLMEDWRQYAVGDAPKPALQAPDTVRVPMTLTNTPFLLLTLRANNIQVQEIWRVTNAANAFTVSNDGELYLTVNEMTILVATVYLVDNFQRLNVAYENLTASAIITVAVDVDVEMEVEVSLILADAPRLYITAGVANDELHVFQAMGGTAPYTYSLTANPDPNAFTFSNGTLSVNDNAAIKVYTFTVVVMDAGGALATAVATAEVGDSQIFILGGFFNDDFVSDARILLSDEALMMETNRANWRRSDHQALSHQGRLYILGGRDLTRLYRPCLNDVWSSADGETWELETADANWSDRYSHQALSHNGRLYVLGGYGGDDGSNCQSGAINNSGNRRLNDVWSSADGKTWKLETANANWSARNFHQALSHNGRLYVLGGYDSNKKYPYYLNDVWSSVDGAEWRIETSDAEWPERYWHQVVSHQGRMYVLGGDQLGGGHQGNDVWSSVDGKVWQQETTSAGWKRRYAHQALSRHGRIYVLGGVSEEDHYVVADMWSSGGGKAWRRDAHSTSLLRVGYQAVVFPPELALAGVSEWLPMLANTAVDNLHTFKAQYGVGDYTYSLLAPVVSGFSVLGGVLSADDSVPSGEYTLTVQVEDAIGGRTQTLVRIIVYVSLDSLALTDAPPLLAFAGAAAEVHAFGGGAASYALAAQSEYFTLHPGNGHLSVLPNVIPGLYTLTVEVDGWMDDMTVLLATVEVLPPIPPLFTYHSVAKALLTFAISGGLGEKTYAVVGGDDDGHFALDNGILSALPEVVGGLYLLTVEASFTTGPSNKATAVAVVEVGSQILVLGGGVWTSPDGATWRQVETTGWHWRSSHQAIANRGRLYVLGGTNSNDVWSSGNGRDWVLETADAGWIERYGHQAVSHQGRMYLLGGRDPSSTTVAGQLNDVWSSVDGKNWVLVTMNAPWKKRLRHQAVSLNGRIYVVGGSDGLSYIRDVWSSADGKNWVQEVMDDFYWNARGSHQVVSHHGNLYLLAGVIRTYNPYVWPIKKDVWVSANGRNWAQKTDISGMVRFAHQAVSHRGRIYVMGGVRDGGGGGAANNTLRDVWSSTNGDRWHRVQVDNTGWADTKYFQAIVFPPNLSLDGVGEPLTVTAGEVINYLHTFTARDGGGNYTYSGSSVAGFSVSPDGVLSAGGATKVGEYTLTVWVEDALGNNARTVVRLKVE